MSTSGQNFKIIFIDIDGTLINKERELSKGTVKEIRRVSSQGVRVILASSRMPKSMRYFLEEIEINEPIICHNGALIQSEIRDDRSTDVLLSVPLVQSVAEAVYEAGRVAGIHAGFYLHDYWYEEKIDRWAQREINNTKAEPEITGIKNLLHEWKEENLGPHKIMCMGEGGKMDLFTALVKEKCGESIAAYRSKKTYLEITSAKTSKKTAAGFLQNKYGIKQEEVIAIGDNYNDSEMISWAGLGVAMGNAHESIKQLADYVAPTNNDDGVAHVIKKYFP